MTDGTPATRPAPESCPSCKSCLKPTAASRRGRAQLLQRLGPQSLRPVAPSRSTWPIQNGRQGTAAPTVGGVHGPPFYIFYFLYTVNYAFYLTNRPPRLASHQNIHVPGQTNEGRGGSSRTGWPFRRNGIAVPAQRHHRSGATVSPFRRNRVAVPAQRHRRSGATGWG